jgi:proton-dependent oligopeptide transporter, POT family
MVAVVGGLALMALGTGILQPALYAGVKHYTSARVAGMGFSLLYAIMNLGIMAESLVSPLVRTRDRIFHLDGLGWGIHGVLWCMTVITLLQLVVHLLLFPRDRPEATEEKVAADAGGWLAPLKDPRFVFFIFMLLPVRTLFAHQWLTIPGYIFSCFDQSVKDRYEWVAALNPAVVTIGVPLFTLLTGHVNVLRMMIIGTAVSAAATFFLSLPPDLSRLIMYVMLFSLGEALWASRFLEYIAQIAPPGKVGAYMGAANLPWFMAKLTTGLYSGYMIQTFLPGRPELLWTLYGLFALTTPVGLLLASGWLRNSTAPASKEPSEPNETGLTKSAEEGP